MSSGRVGIRGLVSLANLAEARRLKGLNRVVVRRGGEELAQAMIQSVRRLGG